VDLGPVQGENSDAFGDHVVEERILAGFTMRDIILSNLAPALGGIGERLVGRVPLAAGATKQRSKATLELMEGHSARQR
jgi:hypothetical protein